MKILITDSDDNRITALKDLLSPITNPDILKSAKKTFTVFNYGNGIKTYDVLFIADYMKDFDNTRTISKIREREEGLDDDQKLLIIILASEVDKWKVFEFYKLGCSDFLIPPYDKDALLKKIESKVVKKRADEKNLAQSVKKEFFKSDIDLPTLPDIYFQFKVLVDKDADFSEMAELLKKDITISAKLLRLSNSAYFGGVERNKTVIEAVSRLGLSETHQLVAAICTKELFVTKNERFQSILDKLFNFSLSMAFATQIMADKLKLPDKGYPFVMGLLGNLGRLLMIVVVAELERKKKNQELGINVVISTVEKFHASFAVKILRNWEFSEDFLNNAVENVYNKSKVKRATSKISSILRISLFIAAKDSEFGPEFFVPQIEKIISENSFPLNMEDIEHIMNETSDIVDFFKF